METHQSWTQRSSTSHFWRLAGAEALLVAPLSILFLGRRSLWLDEGFSARIIALDWRTFWLVLSEGEGMHGLHYVFLKLWSNLGDGEFVLRAPSVVFAAGAVATLALLGRELFGPRIGLTAGLLFAVNPFLLRYSQEARGYALAVWLVTLSSYAFIRLTRQPQRRWAAAYVVLSALAAYAHMFALLVVMAHACSLVVTRNRIVPVRMLLSVAFGIGVLLVPLGLFVLTTNREQASWVQPSGLLDLIGLFAVHSGSLYLWFPYVGFAILGLFTASRHRGRTTTMIAGWPLIMVLLWLCVPILVVFLVSYAMPLFVPRYLIVSLPPLVLLVALGISRLHPPRLQGAILLMIGLSLLALPDAHEPGDWKGATQLISSAARPGDVIVLQAEFIQAPYDYYRGRLTAPGDPPLLVTLGSDAAGVTPVQLQDRPSPWGVTRLLNPDPPHLNEVPPGRVWLVIEYPTESDLVQVRNSLATSHELNVEWDFDGVLVTLYDVPTAP